MKKYFLTILAITFAFNLFSQYNSWDGPRNSSGVLIGIKPNSKFRMLNIFINVIYDVNDSLNSKFPGGAWPQAGTNESINTHIPNYLLGFMDTVYSSQNKGVITRFYGESSFDSL
jgi:hypothetical protein